MISSLATTTVALAAAETHPTWGFGWWFLFIPLFWILIIGLVIALVGRRHRRYWAQANNGYGYGPGAWGPWAASGVASAETVLSERFARGDIDEKEYRARLEVLRASGRPPVPPKA